MEQQQKLFEGFDLSEQWKEEWQDMPEFVMEDLEPLCSLVVNFKSEEDRDDFLKLLGQTLYHEQRSIWYPKLEIRRYANKRYVDESSISDIHNF